jgi:hypothetical protein
MPGETLSTGSDHQPGGSRPGIPAVPDATADRGAWSPRAAPNVNVGNCQLMKCLLFSGADSLAVWIGFNWPALTISGWRDNAEVAPGFRKF